MNPKFTITVDKFKCVGSTQCLQTAPHIFGLDKDKQARVMDQATEDKAKLIAAAEACPVGAIRVVEIETGVQLFP
jgi:ferredoxin